jgi:hypothetical protein
MARRAIQDLDSELTARGKEFKRQMLRWSFLFGIQRLCPDFWGTLNEAWRKYGATNALRHWAPLVYGFVRDEWFLQVILDTLQHWTAHPDSAEARLDAGVPWFHFQPSCTIPQFKTRFPTPSDVGPRIVTSLPDPEDFLRQQDEEYRRYRASYGAFLRDVTTNPAESGMEAQVTVLKWAGLTIREIKDRWMDNSPGIARRRANPEQIIKDAVKRFSADIDLHIPKSWSRKCGVSRIPNS